jgi:hypothetical protein
MASGAPRDNQPRIRKKARLTVGRFDYRTQRRFSLLM